MDILRQITAAIPTGAGSVGLMTQQVTPTHVVDPGVPLGGTTQWMWGATGNPRDLRAATVGYFLATQSRFNAALELVGWSRGEVDALSGLVATHGSVSARNPLAVRERALTVSLNPKAADDPLVWAVLESHPWTLSAMRALSDLIVTLHRNRFTPEHIYTIATTLAEQSRIPIATTFARAVQAIPAIPWHPDFAARFVSRIAFESRVDVVCVLDELSPSIWRQWGPIAIERLCIQIGRQDRTTPPGQVLPRLRDLVAALRHGDARMEAHRVSAERRSALFICLLGVKPLEDADVSCFVDAVCALETNASTRGEHDETICAVLRTMAANDRGRPNYNVGTLCAALPAAIVARPRDRWDTVEWRTLLTDLAASWLTNNVPAAFAGVGRVLPILESLGCDHTEARNIIQAYFVVARESASEPRAIAAFVDAAIGNGWDPSEVKSILLTLFRRHGMDTDAILTDAAPVLRVLQELGADPATQVWLARHIIERSERRSEFSEAASAMRALGEIGTALVPVRGARAEKVRCVVHLVHTLVPLRLAGEAEMLRRAKCTAAFDGSIEGLWAFIVLHGIGSFLRTMRENGDALALKVVNLWDRCTTPERLREALAEGLALLFLAGHRWDDATRRRDIETIVPQWEGIAHIPFARLGAQLELAEIVQGIQSIPWGPMDKIHRIRRLAQDLDAHFIGLQEEIHNHPSRANIAYVQDLLNGNRRLLWAVGPLEELLQLLKEFYDGRIDWAVFRATLTPTLDARLPWTTGAVPTFDKVIALARAVRAEWKHIPRMEEQDATKNAIALARLAIGLQKWAFAMAGVEAAEVGTARQAEKMAVVIATLYGSGYGNDGWLAVVERLRTLHTQWKRIPDPQRQLRSLAALARRMVLEVQASYHEQLDLICERHGAQVGLRGLAAQQEFITTCYRAMAVYPLSEHVRVLEPGPADLAVSGQVLELLAMPALPKREASAPLAIYMDDDPGMPIDRRVIGGKAAGLHYLTQTVPHHVPRWAVGTVQPSGYRLTASDKRAVRRVIAMIESRSGRRFGRDLFVSIRSGAALSMRGAMDSILDIGTFAALYRAIETVYASWDNDAARAYRERHGIPDDWGTAVSIVAMVDGTKDAESGAGIMTSHKPPAYGRQVAGEALVRGAHPGTDPLPSTAAATLAEYLPRFKNDWDGDDVEVEVTVESGRLSFLQIRAAYLSTAERIAALAARVRAGRLTKAQAIRAFGGRHVVRAALQEASLVVPEATHPFFTGPVGEGPPTVGQLVATRDGSAHVRAEGGNPLWVTATPDARSDTADVLAAGGLIAAGGNLLAHLPVVAAHVGLPVMVGLPVTVDRSRRRIQIDGHAFKEGDTVTIHPAVGALYSGLLTITQRRSPVADDIAFLLE